jgi:hypothetical protein
MRYFSIVRMDSGGTDEECVRKMCTQLIDRGRIGKALFQAGEAG